jgi:carbonic anhydrase/acetyltransferase-like protein (isoleucine patch superfamily)
MVFKGALFYKLDSIFYNLGPRVRKVGQDLFNYGNKLQGSMGHRDTMVPSLRCVPISNSKYPKSLDADWVAPNAVLVGDISLGEGSSVWHGVTLRGDRVANIKVGRNSMIQDNSYVGAASKDQNLTLTIGDNVYVGPNVTLDACHLESFSYIGMGAYVGKGCVVESFGVLAAGARLENGARVPSGQIFAGSPAKYLRDVSQQEKHLIGEHSLEMQ